MEHNKIILAVPKGRILDELNPLFASCGIKPEDEFNHDTSRKIRFKTNHETLEIIKVRSFDVATFVAYGGAHLGIVGSDVLEEFNYKELYAPLDLGIGTCRLSIAAPEEDHRLNLESASHVNVATKYPHITARYFESRGIQAECIKLNGAMEIAPDLGLASFIVDLVSTGSTLKANKLKEIETILHVSSRLVANRGALKTMPDDMGHWIEQFRKAVA